MTYAFRPTYRRLVTLNKPFKVDLLDNLYGIYCLKRVVRTYFGPVVRLRRASDNVEADFGAGLDDWIDRAAITTWVGGSSARVSKVYDQSGNTRDLAQATSGAQPLLDLSASHPRLHFTRTTPEYLGNAVDLATFARNISAVSVLHVGIFDVNTVDDQYNVFISNGVSNTQPRIAMGVGINDNIANLLHRRTDAASTNFGTNINWTDTTTWVTWQGRVDFSGGSKRLRLNTTVADTTFTGGLSQDTDAIATAWGSRNGVDQGANMKATALFLIRDAITNAEMDALARFCEELKAP